MKLRKKISNIIQEFLNEGEIQKIINTGLSVGDKIEGGFLSNKEAEDLQRKIESNYDDSGVIKFGKDSSDLRSNLFNYENPIAEKDVNGVNLRIANGFVEDDLNSGTKRKTYLLYADGKIVGKFYSVEDIKKVIKYIESNLIKTLPPN
jgi:hypothetical protein